jgi:hypothetical protein
MNNRKHTFSTRQSFRATVLGAMAVLSTGWAALAEPTAVVMTTPVGEESDASLDALISSWKATPTVTEVLHIRNQAVDSGKFGDLVAISFASEAAHQAWVSTEQSKIDEDVRVRSARVLTDGEITPRDTNSAVFKINDYEPVVSPEEYDKFADGYIRPLLEGQIAANLMTRYTTYYENGTDGLVWSIYEYTGSDALESAGKIKEGIRANLTETNATYRAFHPIKTSLRNGGGETFAVVVANK